jgi:CRISPR/Cas system CMR-associated protein Cmr3 (group 5 of RAMP superfamily)
MDMADVDKAQVVYICKKDMEVKTYPENDTMEFDTGRWNEIMKKAERVSLAIQENHFPKKEEEIPFGKCGCFPCNSEGENQFGHLHD